LAKLLRAHGITGWRRQLQVRIAERGTRNKSRKRAVAGSFRTPRSALRVLSVRPDFIFRQVRLAVFVDGCFWHGCPRHATQPKGNASFWRKKLAANKARDRRVNRVLRAAGWRVVRIWEHELRQSGKRKEACRKPRHLTPALSPIEAERVAKPGMPSVVRRIQRAITGRDGALRRPQRRAQRQALQCGA
jgi:DNA mismatch endonuclease (patch repair protein)